MSERYFERGADLLGLVAYWTVMYGRLPDRELLEAVYNGTGAQPAGGRSHPHLTLAPPSSEPPPAKPNDSESIEAAA